MLFCALFLWKQTTYCKLWEAINYLPSEGFFIAWVNNWFVNKASEQATIIIYCVEFSLAKMWKCGVEKDIGCHIWSLLSIHIVYAAVYGLFCCINRGSCRPRLRSYYDFQTTWRKYYYMPSFVSCLSCIPIHITYYNYTFRRHSVLLRLLQSL